MSAVLTLNSSYEPLTLLPLKTALRLVVQEKAEVVEADPGHMVRSEKREIPKPAVIRLFKYVKVPQKMRKGVTNYILYARDGYRCQYCGRHEEELRGREHLTRDHVHPQSKGGQNTWENCVTACTSCNHAKADKSLREAGMKLLSVPKAPDMVWLKWSVRKLTPLAAKYVEAGLLRSRCIEGGTEMNYEEFIGPGLEAQAAAWERQAKHLKAMIELLLPKPKEVDSNEEWDAAAHSRCC